MGTSMAAYGIGLAVLLGALFALGADSMPSGAIFASMLAFAALFMAAKQKGNLFPSRFFWSGAAALLVLAIAQLIAISKMTGRADWHATTQEAVILVGAVACFILGHCVCLETKFAARAFRWLVAVLLGVSILSFVDFAAAPDQIFGRDKPFHHDRLTVPFLSANTAATFFGISTVLAFGQLLNAGRGTGGGVMSAIERIARHAVLSLLLFAFGLTALLLTGSRAGLVATGVGLLALFLWDGLAVSRSSSTPPGSIFRRVGIRTVGGVVGGAGLLAMSWAISGEVAQDRLLGLQTDDAGRFVLWEASWQAFLDAPIWGHGLGQFSTAIAPHITQATAPTLVLQGAAHNLLLQWLVQTGVVGTVVGATFVALIGSKIVSGLRRRRRQRTLIRTVLTIWGVVLMHGLLDYGVEIPAILWLLGLLLGMGSGIAAGHSEQKHNPGA
ncbi:MAG: O-antigen ligase family protein [Pseudomonadota bacterium]